LNGKPVQHGLPVLHRHRPPFCNVVQRQIEQFEQRLVAGECPTVIRDLAQTSVKQVAIKLSGKKMPDYYRVRKEGIKRYIRFPHHTCLIFFFWLHPVMTLDTLFLAIAATIYLYVGTYHQDLRGLRLIGKEWEVYRLETNLLLPTQKTVAKMLKDWRNDPNDTQPEEHDQGTNENQKIAPQN
jgi:hypothetical protein